MQNQDISLELMHPAWTNAPAERDPRYFQTWQRVSIAFQKALRTWIPELYFRDHARYEDRDTAYQLVVYQACRICYGRPKTEFTYDVADPDALPAAFRTIGRSIQTSLSKIEKRLHAEGRPQLARRYAPVWYQDVLVAVRKKPKPLIDLLAREAALINAVIDLGTTRDQAAVNRFSRASTNTFRSVFGMDMQELGGRMLQEATRVLAAQPRSSPQHQDPVILAVADEDASAAVDADSVRPGQTLGHGGDDATPRIDAPDGVILGIGDVDRAIG